MASKETVRTTVSVCDRAKRKQPQYSRDALLCVVKKDCRNVTAGFTCVCVERRAEGWMLYPRKGQEGDEGGFCHLVKPSHLYPTSPLLSVSKVSLCSSSTLACVSVSDVCLFCVVAGGEGWKTSSPCRLLWNLVTCCHEPAPSCVTACVLLPNGAA